MQTARTHYDRVAIALHWLIGLALLAQIAFGFLLDDLAPRNTPARANIINLHKSIGIVLGFLILLRLVWALTHRAPPLPASMPGWQKAAAVWSHRLLYLCMVVMPLSGYIGSNFTKYGVKFFGNEWKPWGPEDKQIYAIFNGTHKFTAVLFAVLIVLHVVAAIRHAMSRDGVMLRMVPVGGGEPRS